MALTDVHYRNSSIAGVVVAGGGVAVAVVVLLLSSLFTLETPGGHVHLVGSFSFSRPQLENILGLSEVTIYRLTLSPE